VQAVERQFSSFLLAKPLDCHRISDGDAHQIRSCFKRARVYRRSAREISAMRLRGCRPGGRVMCVDGEFRFNSWEISGCILWTGVRRCKHLQNSGILSKVRDAPLLPRGSPHPAPCCPFESRFRLTVVDCVMTHERDWLACSRVQANKSVA